LLLKTSRPVAKYRPGRSKSGYLATALTVFGNDLSRELDKTTDLIQEE
jgi:hypothetical protein